MLSLRIAFNTGVCLSEPLFVFLLAYFSFSTFVLRKLSRFRLCSLSEDCSQRSFQKPGRRGCKCKLEKRTWPSKGSARKAEPTEIVIKGLLKNSNPTTAIQPSHAWSFLHLRIWHGAHCHIAIATICSKVACLWQPLDPHGQCSNQFVGFRHLNGAREVFHCCTSKFLATSALLLQDPIALLGHVLSPMEIKEGPRAAMSMLIPN